MRTETAILSDRIAEIYVRDHLADVCGDAVKTFFICALVALIKHILCGGADEHIAVDGGAHQLALCDLGGDGENDVVDLAGGLLVEYVELTLTGSYNVVVLADVGCDLVAIKSCGVDDVFALDVALVGLDGGNRAVLLLDADNTGRKLEMHAVVGCVFCKRDAEEEGIDDTLAGNVKSALYARIELGLHFEKLCGSLVLNVVNAVFDSLVLDRGKLLKLLVVECGKDRADALEGDVKILADLVVHGVCGNDKAALECAGLCVVTGVDDGAV